jgi:hypothetical protein
MARIRGVKPDFFKDEDLACLPYEARLFFEGLWCHADRAGRLEYRPRYLKAEIFPYDNVDVVKLLHLLSDPKIPERPHKVFIRFYQVDDKKYIDIPEFLKHQVPHSTEKKSVLPEYNTSITVNEPLNNGSTTVTQQEESVQIPVQDTVQKKAMERECEGKPKLPVDNFSSDDINPADFNPKKTASSKKPKTEKQDDPDLIELQKLVNQVKVKYPRLPVETWYGKNRKAPMEKIFKVLRSFLKAELKHNDPTVMAKYLQNSIDVEIGKYNARQEEADHEDRIRPTGIEFETLGNLMGRALAAQPP